LLNFFEQGFLRRDFLSRRIFSRRGGEFCDSGVLSGCFGEKAKNDTTTGVLTP
jgi:hypothetical protein